MISPFGIHDGTSFEIVFPVLNHINVAPNYFIIYSEPKEKVMFIVLEELIGTLSHLPLPGQYLIADAHSLLGAHDFKVSEYLIERKWCFSPFLIQLMWYIQKQFFTSVSVEMLIWLLQFYVISFLPVCSISALYCGYFLAAKDGFHYSIWNGVPRAKMCYIFNFVVLQLSFSGKILHLK